MQVSKSLKWLEPYLEDIKPILPELVLLTSIAARSPKGRNSKELQRSHAMCHKKADGTFKIMLNLKRQMIEKIRPVEICMVEYSTMDLLGYLAHELAHLRYWEHSPHRLMLECRILILFMKKAIKNGYISEEFEYNIPLNKHLDKITSN